MKRSNSSDRDNGAITKKQALSYQLIAPETRENSERDPQNESSRSVKQSPNFRFKKIIGEGVFGIVYSVLDEQNKEYAMKFMRSENKENGWEFWKHEKEIMEAVTKSENEHLVKLRHSGVLPSCPNDCLPMFVMMDLMGPSLLDIIESAKDQNIRNDTHEELKYSFPVHAIRTIGSQILSAMQALEKLNIMHLDLKPENVFFTSPTCSFGIDVTGDVCFIEMTDLRVCVGDFGCARFLTIDLKRKFEIVQTQNYRSPEIFLGLPVTMKSDVWSYACILCEMYTGLLLFYGSEQEDTIAVQFEMMQVVVQQEPTPRMLKEAADIKSDRITVSSDNNLYMKQKITSNPVITKPLRSNIRTGDISAQPLFELLEYLLIIDPKNRPSFDDARLHQFFK